MASYQIPQFLDSGDKILGPLNMRQFGYALFGFMLATVVFSIIQNAAPGIGVYAAIPCLPIVALFAYLALGKFNGRDSEIYVLKFIVFMVKPRLMVYCRVPDNTELDAKLAKNNYNGILAEWNSRLAKQKQMDNNQLADFTYQNATLRAQKIRQLGNTLDSSLYNTLNTVQRRELEIRAKETMIQATTGKPVRAGSGPQVASRVVPTPAPAMPETPQTTENFFENQPNL